MSDTRRLDSLRRRVQQDPASIAFAALADEYRRLGLFHDAIETCRAGLTRHPAYLSARVTLGRSLLEIGEYDEAQAELEQVMRAAPDNLAAIRALAEIHRRKGESPDTYVVEGGHDPAPAAAKPETAPAPAASDALPSQPEPAAGAGTPDAAGPPAGGLATPAPVAAPAPASAGPAPLPVSTVAAGAAPLEVVSHMAGREGAPAPVPAHAGAAPSGPAEPSAAAGAAPAPPPAVAADPVCERLEQFLAAIDRARAGQEGDGAAESR